jgi:hypothetical protein
MVRSASRLILVLIAAAAIAISAGGFSWDDGSAAPDSAVVDGSSVGSSGSATLNGFSWDDGAASLAAVAP